MAGTRWYSLLADALDFSPAFTAELARQLGEQAKAIGGIELDDGYHAFMPPDDGFEVHYEVIRGVTIASVEGELLGPNAEAFPAVLAWRSRTGGEVRPTANPEAGALELFWMELPPELGSSKVLDAGSLRTPGRFRFAIHWVVYAAPDVWLTFTAHTVFSSEHQTAIAYVLDEAMAAWNRNHDERIHFLGRAQLDDDGRMIAVQIDLGSAGLSALDSLLRAVSDSDSGGAIARCRIGGR